MKRFPGGLTLTASYSGSAPVSRKLVAGSLAEFVLPGQSAAEESVIVSLWGDAFFIPELDLASSEDQRTLSFQLYLQP